MGDIRFERSYQLLEAATDRAAVLRSLSDDEVIGALAVARGDDPYLANVLASEAMNRIRRKSIIVESASEGLLSQTADGLLTYMNPAAERMLGWTLDEFMGEPVHDVIHYKHRDGSSFPAEECPIFNVGRTGESVLGHRTMLVRKDGSTFPAEQSAAPIVRDGEIEGVVVTFTDITEREAAEQALAASEARARHLFMNNPAPTVVYDRETGEILAVNEAALATYGYPLEEFLEMNAADFRPLEDVAQFKTYREEHRPGTQAAGEWRHLTKDGTLLTVEVVTHATTWEGRPAIIAAVQDVSERKRNEDAIRESERKYREIVERSPMPIAVHSGGKLLYLNAKAVELIGVDSAEPYLGQPITQFIHPDSLELALSRVRTVQLERRPLPPAREKFLRTDGTVLHVEVASMPVTFEGKPAVQVVLRDLTDQVRAEEEAARLAEELERRVRDRTRELTAANHDLEAFTYLVSHDLKEPVRAIEAYLNALKEDHRGELSPDAVTLLEESREATARLTALLRGLLEISRAGRRGSFDLEPVDVRATVGGKECAVRYEHLLRERGGRLDLQVEPGLTVAATPASLSQLLGNLIVNGLVHNPSPAPLVRVAAAPAGEGQVLICVEDNGAGFSAEATARFNEASAPGTALAENRLSSGFGLLIATRIAERLGGTMRLARSDLGGAMVCLTLPRAAPSAARNP